jgi:hypothetical protein
MPIYGYKDEDTGISVELWRPVEKRNEPIVLVRDSSVPDRISIHGLEPSEGDQFDAKIIRSLHKKEESNGNDFRGVGGFSKKRLKEVWVDGKR